MRCFPKLAVWDRDVIRGTARALAGVMLAAAGMLVSPLGASPAGATILTGNLTADDGFYAYLSTRASTAGTPIGSGNSWSTTWNLTPTALLPGNTYYLNIEAYDGGQPGGFIGTFTLSDTDFHFANGSQTLDTEATDWTGVFNAGGTNSPQPWVTPDEGVAVIGGNGASPWGDRSGIDSNADWIWPNDPTSLPDGTACGGCVVDLQAVILPATGAIPEPVTTGILLSSIIGIGVLRHRRFARRRGSKHCA